MCLYHRVIRPKDADGMADSVDPDQTAPLFAQTYLSENLEDHHATVIIRKIQTSEKMAVASLKPDNTLSN